MKTKIVFIACVSFLLTQCTTRKSVSFLAETSSSSVEFPVTLKNIRLLNRTRPTKRGVLETVIDGQGLPFTNKNGVDQVFSSFANEVSKRKYFEVKYPIKNTNTEQSLDLPTALTFEELTSYFNDTMSVVASLEVFQVQEKEEYYAERKMQLDTAGREYFINIIRGIKTLASRSGWRLYNGKTGEILDEFLLDHDLVYDVEGFDRPTAAAKMEAKIDGAYAELGNLLGLMYAERVSPVAIFVSRSVYTKSKSCPELKQAKYFIKENDWETANDIWKDAIATNSVDKDIAKIYYNLGVYQEKLGNLDEAIKLLEQSITYNKLGLEYLNQLKDIRAVGYPVPNPKTRLF